MTNHVNIVLLSLGALQGALVSFVLLRKKPKDRSHIFFVLFLIVIGLQLTFKGVAKSWLWNNVQLIYLLSYSLPFLVGPLLYLFVRARKHLDAFRALDCMHFLPFLLYLLHTLVDAMYGYNFFPPLVSVLFPGPTMELISLSGYTLAAWKHLRSIEEESIRQGLKQFLLWVVSAETIILIAIALMVRNLQTFPDVRLLFVALTVLIYWISYKLLSEPEIFLTAAPDTVTEALRIQSAVKYAHSGLKPAEADRIATLLNEAIQRQKIFLHADVSLEKVAVQLRVPKHHLSRVINERFNKTFLALANDWRLDEACARLIDPRFRNCTISTIAFDSGFSSPSSFNAMFKRRFHVTPSAYRELNANEMRA